MRDSHSIYSTAVVVCAAAAILLGGASSAAAQESGSTVTPEKVPPPPPAVSPAALQPLVLEYESTISMGEGNHLTLTSTRQMGPATFKGRDAWRVATTTLGGAHGGTDVFYLDPSTLLPFHRATDRGGSSLDIAYEDGWVRGYETTVDGRRPVNVSVPGSVFGDGGALDALLVSLPLEKGYGTSFEAFDLATRTARRWDVKVVGDAQLELPAGDFATYRVTVTPGDGGQGGGVFWVRRDQPRMVVESRTRLPGSKGGDEVLTVLQSWKLSQEAAPKPE